MKVIFSLVICVLGLAETSVSQPAWTRLPGTFDYVSQLRFYDRDTGFLITKLQGFLKTTDGGATWNPVNLPVESGFYFKDFYLLHQNIWLVGTAKSNGKAVRILFSSNIGQTWSVIPFDSSHYPYEIAFASKDTGYLLYHLDPNECADSYPAFTSDGGQHWMSRDRRFCTSELKVGYASNISLSDMIQDPPDFARILSNDYGASFVFFGIPQAKNYSYCGEQVWLAGNSRSSDGGKTWQEGFGSLYKWSDTSGTAYSTNLSNDSLSISHDRGLSGKSQPFYPGILPYKIEVIDSSFAYAVTGDPFWKEFRLYKTVSGGEGDFEKSLVSSHTSDFDTRLILNSKSIALGFTIRDFSNVSIEVFDLLGRPVHPAAKRLYSSGEYTVPIHLEQSPPGSYYVRVALNNDEVRTMRLMKD
jgi:hypothetical protein